MSAAVEVEDRNGLPWTPEDIRFALRTDLSTHEIARRLGRSYRAVTTLRGRVRKAATSCP